MLYPPSLTLPCPVNLISGAFWFTVEKSGWQNREILSKVSAHSPMWSGHCRDWICHLWFIFCSQYPSLDFCGVYGLNSFSSTCACCVPYWLKARKKKPFPSHEQTTTFRTGIVPVWLYFVIWVSVILALSPKEIRVLKKPLCSLQHPLQHSWWKPAFPYDLGMKYMQLFSLPVLWIDVVSSKMRRGHESALQELLK